MRAYSKLRYAALYLLSMSVMGVLAPAGAAVPEREAARLQDELSPVGAVRAAGQLRQAEVPRRSKRGLSDLADEFEEIVDPPTRVGAWPDLADTAQLRSEAPLFAITAATLNRYRDYLTASHFALLQTNPNTFFMNVYPSRRTVRWPEAIERATIANATRCTLEGTDTPVGCRLGFPFPIPQSGAEVIWNHKLRWRGDAISQINSQLVVRPDGNHSITRLAEDFVFDYANLANPGRLDRERRSIYRYLSRVLSPPRIAGHAVLIHERSGVGSYGRMAWQYRPGDPRQRRAPEAAFDQVYEGADGLQFFDQIDVFNGALERYDWTLVGRREIFVPYNAVLLDDASSRPEEIVHPTHLNPKVLRYELHRVWVVEATLRPGQRHAIRKRRFYVDEDSWTILCVDMLDNYGDAYQFQEAHIVYEPQMQRPRLVANVIYNRESTRYLVSGLRLDGPPVDAPAFAPGHFEPATLVSRGSAATAKR
ncbi:Protein of unknown function [Fontimonas thermophila]|uniref:Outer membrane lipoprotein-sorting protein n=1 Tax=Fontimonas thermophila TaxID=1076937 RepID=A0A1I2JL07_9GAMM|nr:DUF1329 domain-containing protein [Fontimonas thermophila]SFF54563.1 Protein of unknown function [Fontimonas thermophila]